MRAFSVLSTITALALSVSAASLNKRAISNSVQSCVDGLVDSNVKLLDLTSFLSAFVRADGYTGAVALHSREQALEGSFKNTSTACCAVTTTFTNEEANTVYDLVGNFVPDITSSFEVINSKKPELDAILFATHIAKTDIQTLSTLLKQVDGCLIAVTPDNILARAQAYMDTISADLAATYAVYNITS